MKNRKIKIIDKKFQLRAILSVGFIAVAFLSAIIAAVTFFSLRSRTNIAGEITRLQSAVETQDNIVTAFIKYSAKARGNPVKLSIDTVKKDHEESMETIRSHISMLERHSNDYFYLLLITIAITILVIAVFYIYMLQMTHRISGPIFVMSRHIQDMIDGKEPQFRSLRDKDEFKDMYAKLVELGGKMKVNKA